MCEKIKVVIIEDDQNLINLLSLALESENYDICTVNDSLQAVNTVENAQPDLILLDWIMPGKNGIEVLADLKENERTKEIPVFMVTAKNMLNDINHMFSAGADDYICKPFNTDIIAQQIRSKLRLYKQRKK